MWDSALQDDDGSETDEDWGFADHDFNGPRTPSTIDDTNPDSHAETRALQYEQDNSDAGTDEEYGAAGSKGGPRRKKGGYDSRIEQILYENPELPILIVDAGKSNETGGKYIVYTIRTGVRVEDGMLEALADLGYRILKFAGGIPNLLRSEMLCRNCIRPS